MLADGDKVVTRWTRTGTHSGEYRGVPATGRRVTHHGFRLLRIEGGKVVETWGTEDMLGVMQQLGVVDKAVARTD